MLSSIQAKIQAKPKISSKPLRPKSTAVTGSTNSKSATENLSKTNSETNLNTLSTFSKSKVQPNLKEMADSLEEDNKNNSSKVETITEVNEEKKLEHSKISENNIQQPIMEEVHESAEEIKQRLQYLKFKTDPTFTELTKEFMQKLATNFLAKDSTKIECTSFVNTVYNLYTQHVGKIVNKNKDLDIDEETKEVYFLFILNYIQEKKFFEGEIFELWRTNGCRTLRDMNKLSMITVNKDRLKEEFNSISDKSLKNLINDNSNLSIHKSFEQINNAVFKTLREQNFCQPLDGNQLQKPKYLSNIQHFINQYSKSKECSEDDKTLIKLNKKTKYSCL